MLTMTGTGRLKVLWEHSDSRMVLWVEAFQDRVKVFTSFILLKKYGR